MEAIQFDLYFPDLMQSRDNFSSTDRNGQPGAPILHATEYQHRGMSMLFFGCSD
jgi:hypothetical protein